LVFVIVLLSFILFNYWSFSIFFFVIALWGLIEFYQLTEKMGAVPYRLSGLIFGAFTYLSFVQPDMLFDDGIDNPMISFLLIVPFSILAFAIFDKKPAPFTNAIFTVVGIVYVVLPFALLHNLVIAVRGEESSFVPFTLLGVILLIWCNDTFAYLGGSMFGKIKLIERVSPGKTVEGTFTGIVCTFASSFLVMSYFPEDQNKFWITAGLTVPVLATAGDLLQSLIKRQAQVKDSGTIMPGHGGILDRFDSLIFISPFLVVILKLIA